MSSNWSNGDDHVLIEADVEARTVLLDVRAGFEVMDARLARRRAADLAKAADMIDPESRAEEQRRGAA